MPKLTVNGKEVEFDQGMTLLQACELAGEEIPRFCYHERLQIAGNCRMCLVQVEGGPPKPAASCAMPAAEGMKVHTNTPMVKKAREGVMEFLLINHPLDCPICDQGGECDLQDQAMTYGRGSSRYNENKRSVKEKYMGPLVKTEMTRCIQCTRCVRFLEDIAGIEELGAVNRGENMEITTYVEKSLTSELSGNIIDLCPVGALTSKPYEFKSRPWELNKTESIDVLDAVGSNIRIDSRGREVMRILPRLNEEINEEWISDKTRFSYDGLKLQRLDKAYVKKGAKLSPVTWSEAYKAISEKISSVEPEQVAAIAGDMADCESMFAMKKLMDNLGSGNYDCRADGAQNTNKERASYIFNSKIEGIEDADLCLLIGTNPRWDAPIINARLRKVNVHKNLEMALIGEESGFTYPVENLGNDPKILEQILNGKAPFSKKLKAAKKPMIIIGSDIFTRDDAEAILYLANEISDRYGLITSEWKGFNVLHKAASRVGGLDLGFVPQKGAKGTKEILTGCAKGDVKLLFLMGADDIDITKTDKAFVVYLGHHGDNGAHHADVILPVAAYTEKDATYINTEGRMQRTAVAVFPPGEAKADWLAISDLAKVLGQNLGFENLKDLRDQMEKTVPWQLDEFVPAKWHTFGEKGRLSENKITHNRENFYFTNPISRASRTMAECSEIILGKKKDAA